MTQPIPHPDHELKQTVTAELEWTSDLDADEVGVALRQGVVTLSGEVSTFAQKHVAVRAAQRVRGVRGVVDQLVVRPVGALPSDADVARAATAALAASAALGRGTVRAVVREHEVTLTGTVAWNVERDAAARLVGQLDGVVAVHNAIALRPRQEFADVNATARIKAALLRNALTDAANIRVTSQGSEIQLTGTVTSWAEYRQARDAAWSTPGVTHVTNQLTVIA